MFAIPILSGGARDVAAWHVNIGCNFGQIRKGDCRFVATFGSLATRHPSTRRQIGFCKQADKRDGACRPGLLPDTSKLMIDRRKRPAPKSGNFLITHALRDKAGNGDDRAKNVGNRLFKAIIKILFLRGGMLCPVGANQPEAAVCSSQRAPEL